MAGSVVTTSAEVASGKGHRDENFPVASHLIAKKHRPAIMAFYDFVRAADDVADNAILTPQAKLDTLDAMEASLLGRSDAEAVALPLRAVIAERRLTPRHAQDLLDAFRLDVTKPRTADWSELIHYCSLSAMPVGRYVLDVHGEADSTWPASDAICAALQIINHLQDCAKDLRDLDRAYVPLDALAGAGLTLDALRAAKRHAQRCEPCSPRSPAGRPGCSTTARDCRSRCATCAPRDGVVDHRCAGPPPDRHPADPRPAERPRASGQGRRCSRPPRGARRPDRAAPDRRGAAPAAAGVTRTEDRDVAASRASPTAAAVTQKSGSSFYAAMRILPRPQREAMYAVYAFCRAVDDIADEGGSRDQRAAGLAEWRDDIDRLYGGQTTARTTELAAPVTRFGLRQDDLLAVIDGMEMDADADIQAPDWATLDLYCDRVASAVGRLSVRVFGVAEAPGQDLAHHLGRALQLTNILRDIDEDAGIGRLYLPREALLAAGITSTDPAIVVADPAHRRRLRPCARPGPATTSNAPRRSWPDSRARP